MRATPRLSRPLLVTLLLLTLACALPATAWTPPDAPVGLYAARDYRHLDPGIYHLVGSEQLFYWDDIETAPGDYAWWRIDTFIERQVADGKEAAIGVLTFNARANLYTPHNPPIRIPDHVLAAGVRTVICDDGYGNLVEIPRFWDPVYLQAYGDFVRALAARYDGDERVAFVLIGVGKYGETQPSDSVDNDCVAAALSADGADWPTTVNAITDLYADAFAETPLLLPYAPRFVSECGRRTFTDHAIDRGVGLFAAGAYARTEWVDLRLKPGWHGCGKYDRILDHVETGPDEPWVPVAFEMMHYMTQTPLEFYWAMAGVLSRHADYVTLDRQLLYEGDPYAYEVAPWWENLRTADWAAQYLGRGPDEAPAAWVILREAGYSDLFYPQRGNYCWWLAQDDSFVGGRTVATTWRPRSDLVSPQNWRDYGDYAVRQEIETDQPLVEGSREGWICRRTDQASGNPRMWFRLDDRYLVEHAHVAITVTYLDRGTDAWQLVYDGAGDAETVAGPVHKEDTGTWREVTFLLDDARLANGQAGGGPTGADFHLDCLGDGDEYVHRVVVEKRDPGWTCADVGDIPASECQALETLFASTGGADWHNRAHWLQRDAADDWGRVTVRDGHVVRLDLGDNNLQGEIPTALADLPRLEVLNLYRNALTGTVPSELSQLTHLRELRLGENSLSGAIPPELGSLPALEVLDLSGNALTGTIPTTLTALPALAVLDLRDNALSGEIPPALGEAPALTRLLLSGNALSGAIPATLGDLEALQLLYLAENALSGPIPPALGRLAELEALHLSGNHLIGGIPPELADLTLLADLHLARNRLSGPLPPELMQLERLAFVPWLELDLAYNALYTRDDALATFVAAKDPDWRQTQTAPPDGVHVTPLGDGGLAVGWTPIPYQGAGGHAGGQSDGYYEIALAPAPDGPFAVVAQTNGRAVAHHRLADLSADWETLHVAVRSHTPPHDVQPHALTSDWSETAPLASARHGAWLPVLAP